MAFASDLELPGFPTRNSGILRSMHTAIINTFSLRAALRAMFSPNTILSSNTSWHLREEHNRVTDYHLHTLHYYN